MTHPTTITAETGLPFVEIVREFDAPVAAVFRAHTDPELYARWLGPWDAPVNLIEYDATPGGTWRFTTGGEGEESVGFHGVFHAVEPNQLLISTFEFELAPSQVGVSATTFTPAGGRTRLTVREVYPSVEARDAALASGMEYGIREGYERLDELLAG